MEACNCSSQGHWMCDPVRGCVCHRGFIGEQCDVPASDAVVIAHAESGGASGGAVAGMVVVTLAFVAAAALVLLYYRKRVRLLKREIAHVHYTADPAAQPEQQHFDNPVYSYQGSTRSDDSTTLLNNGAHIINNLAPGAKLSNTAMEKLRMTAGGSNGSYDPLSSLKNKDADATNPNLYHCIDDDKLDHVYDEIKHKEGYEKEYDHLNYTPPSNTWKAHYQRMNNGFPSTNSTKSQNTSPILPGQHTPIVNPNVSSNIVPASNTTIVPNQNITPTPPIPPLPKVNLTPIPPRRDDIEVPIPPKRDDADQFSDDELP
ncbi:protein draper-like [Leptidea sinapis]|uniref:protein draper-like n=1 Tax=Leptidea sinapis TaxID=189913 RepID=UPI0021C421D3|nr:protein draper-like [Leptidea sinapis]